MPDAAPPVFVLWETLTDELFERTSKFPRAIRHTLTHRIEGRALDVLEGLVAARYGRGAEKDAALAAVDGQLARLRVLLRLAHRRAHLSHGAYAHLMERIDEAGRQVGGGRASRPAVP